MLAKFVLLATLFRADGAVEQWAVDTGLTGADCIAALAAAHEDPSSVPGADDALAFVGPGDAVHWSCAVDEPAWY